MLRRAVRPVEQLWRIKPDLPRASVARAIERKCDADISRIGPAARSAFTAKLPVQAIVNVVNAAILIIAETAVHVDAHRRIVESVPIVESRCFPPVPVCDAVDRDQRCVAADVPAITIAAIRRAVDGDHIGPAATRCRARLNGHDAAPIGRPEKAAIGKIDARAEAVIPTNTQAPGRPAHDAKPVDYKPAVAAACRIGAQRGIGLTGWCLDDLRPADQVAIIGRADKQCRAVIVTHARCICPAAALGQA